MDVCRMVEEALVFKTKTMTSFNLFFGCEGIRSSGGCGRVMGRMNISPFGVCFLETRAFSNREVLHTELRQ